MEVEKEALISDDRQLEWFAPSRGVIPPTMTPRE